MEARFESGADDFFGPFDGQRPRLTDGFKDVASLVLEMAMVEDSLCKPDAQHVIGVHFPTAAATQGAATARCFVLVAPDAQRTMQTFLGATTQLGPEDVNMAYIEASKVLYLEGYLWDQPRAKAAMRDAAIAAQKAGVKVSLTLSDAFCVDRFRSEFVELINHHVDILFANEAEILSLYQVDEFDDALQQVRGHCEIAALTRSSKGSVIVNGGAIHVIDAEPGVTVVDTTGAGDAFVGALAAALAEGRPLDVATRRAIVAGALATTKVGAREGMATSAELEAALPG